MTAVTIHNRPIKQTSSFKYMGCKWTVRCPGSSMWTSSAIRYYRGFTFQGDSGLLEPVRQSSLCRSAPPCKATRRLSTNERFYGPWGSAPRLWVCVVGKFLPAVLSEPFTLADKFALDLSNVLHEEYQLLPSGRCFRVPGCEKNKYKLSFVPHSVTLFNQQRTHPHTQDVYMCMCMCVHDNKCSFRSDVVLCC